MTKPTVVLVHGAFADGSSWTDVIGHLRASGVDAVAVANPLRGIASDAAYLTSFVSQIDGPVILVGHSYGGALITQTGADADNVVGLVYVAAFAPDVNETLGEINARYPDVALGSALRTLEFPAGESAAAEGYIDHEAFHAAFAADLPVERARTMAAAQRPVALAAFDGAVTGAAWKSLPSWAVVAGGDQAIHPDAERDMADRAGARVVEIDASHAVAVSQPAAVASTILDAVAAVEQHD